ncbi:MAG: tetratricopeptide repeat protein [Actinomycetota bacterium]
MRKNFFKIAIPGIIVGIVLAMIITAISKTKAAPDAALLQPVKSDRATPTDRQIEAAQSAIEKYSTDPGGYNLLAAAFMQKARETGDFSLNARAEKSLEQSFKLAPDNYEAIKLQATLELNYHRFADALETAQRAQQINSGDHEIYGAMVDALVELGEYERAVKAAQKMVDLRPDTASYSRISYLRSLHGDRKGAIDAMKMAADAASPQNTESMAWCRVHLGDELMNDGKPNEAEHQYDYALYLFPDYHPALAAKARARYAAGDNDNAITFYKRAIERVPLPDYIAALGDLYAKLGRADEAKQQYDQVEFIEKMGTTGGTYSRQLALFWADHDMRLDEALSIAENELATRKDIYASDILAWSLYKKGRFDEAKTAIDEALRLNTRDPRLLYHAGLIAAANGDNQKGAEYLKQALDINPFFDILQAEIAKKKLAEVKSK